MVLVPSSLCWFLQASCAFFSLQSVASSNQLEEGGWGVGGGEERRGHHTSKLEDNQKFSLHFLMCVVVKNSKRI